MHHAFKKVREEIRQIANTPNSGIPYREKKGKEEEIGTCESRDTYTYQINPNWWITVTPLHAQFRELFIIRVKSDQWAVDIRQHQHVFFLVLKSCINYDGLSQRATEIGRA